MVPMNQTLGRLSLVLLLPQPMRLFLLQLPHHSLLLFPNFLELHNTPNSRVAILGWGPLVSYLWAQCAFIICTQSYHQGPGTLTHWGMSSVVGATFLFLFRANNSLTSGSGSLWMSSHLGTMVPRGFDIEPSPNGAHWS